MTVRTQKYINKETRELIYEATHIFAEHGHFEKNGHRLTWHIMLGRVDSADNYTEVIDEGVTHEVPDTLPDIEVVVEPEVSADEGSNN